MLPHVKTAPNLSKVSLQLILHHNNGVYTELSISLMNQINMMMIAMKLLMITMVMMVTTTINGASICGTEFQPCSTDRDPDDATISIEDCCEGFTCLATNDYVPPFQDEESAWKGVCLTERMRKIALLPMDLKKYMIRQTYRRDETMTYDHKQPHEADYLVQMHTEQGDFPQLVLRIERKFGIQIEIPDAIPDDYEL
jgi:hypothetical protein